MAFQHDLGGVKSQGISIGIDIFEKNQLPDFISRFGIRELLRSTLKENAWRLVDGVQAQRAYEENFIADLKTRDIAEFTQRANEEHYEVDTKFFNVVLGKHRKYSSALYEDTDISIEEAVEKLDEAESRMLELYAERAQITSECSKEGAALRLLDLGCGWGSVSLWFANRFPNCLKVVGLSNSNTQREYILGEAKRRGLSNLEDVITADISKIEELPSGINKFDRVISIEMFEHMKNYELLLEKVSRFMKPSGLLFVHIFTHRETPYHFIDNGNREDWMTRYFFTGGTMPSDNTLLYFSKDFAIKNHWRVNGVHYSLTLEAWLRKMDTQMDKVGPILDEVYKGQVTLWTARWRGFFLACSELFKFNGGNEWFVSHYLFENRPAQAQKSSGWRL